MSVDDSKKDQGVTDDEYNTLNEDIENAVKKGNDQLGYGGPQKLSVSEGIRAPAGHYLIVGQIATVSSVYKMVSAVNLKCTVCNHKWQNDYRKKPRIEST